MDISTIENLIETHPFLFILGFVWIMIWKGLALWRVAQERRPIWFLVLLITNTLGILEIIYLFFVSKSPLIKRREKVEPENGV